MNSPVATSAVSVICTSIGTAISRVTPCIVRRPEDVYELTGASDPRLPPDGRTVAYVVCGDRPRGERRTARRSGSRRSTARSRRARFTAGEKRDAHAALVAGRHAARVRLEPRRREGPSQLYVIPAEGGEARKLTDLKEGVGAIVWSPDVDAHRVHGARPRRGVRGGGRQEARSRGASRAIPTSSTASAGPATAASTSSSSPVDGGEATPAHRRRLRGRRARPGRPTASRSCSRRRATTTGTRADQHVLRRRRRGRRAEAADPGDEAPTTHPSCSPDGSTHRVSRAARRLATYPHHTQIAVMDARRREREAPDDVARPPVRPVPGPYREPIWDGDRSLFAIEDGGNIHLYARRGRRPASPSSLVGGEPSVTGFDVARRDARLRGVDAPTMPASSTCGDARS